MSIHREFNTEEWKMLVSLAKKYRKRDGTLGTSRSYIQNLMAAGLLELESISIDGNVYYHIPLEWQKKENWNLNEIKEATEAKKNEKT